MCKPISGQDREWRCGAADRMLGRQDIAISVIPLARRWKNKLREHQRQYLDHLLYYLAASGRTDDVSSDTT
ncbi:hypothetical protein ACDQ55_15925 [Chitinophaga sp. 30R24]|uniref:hypothetical protein n=1 Tax=Chitinophaga sp. 30R24 TaxID=3248838 RepID=UPI003B91B323